VAYPEGIVGRGLRRIEAKQLPKVLYRLRATELVGRGEPCRCRPTSAVPSKPAGTGTTTPPSASSHLGEHGTGCHEEDQEGEDC